MGLALLQEYEFSHTIEYLKIAADDGWDNYKFIFALCPNLKGISIYTRENGEVPDLKENFDRMSQEIKIIWNERIAYLKTKGIMLMTNEEYNDKIKELHHAESKWGFEFHA